MNNGIVKTSDELQKHRSDGRTNNDMRSISLVFGKYSNAHGSVIFCLGGTQVLCSVSVQHGVPSFLKGSGTGWLTAEYSLLPSSTRPRSVRDLNACKRNGRAVEISRLIGRVLRTVVDLSALGERTVYIDCDVLKADGGTRVASITGASLALFQAQNHLLSAGILNKPFVKEGVGAVSIGVSQGISFVDPNSREDSTMDADLNFVITQSKRLIEVQGGAEKEPLSWDIFDAARLQACTAIEQMFAHFVTNHAIPSSADVVAATEQQQPAATTIKNDKQSLFSLINR